MELWDQVIGSQSGRMKELTPSQLLQFGAACVDHALAVKTPDFIGVRPEHMFTVNRSLEQLWDYLGGKLDRLLLSQSIDALLPLFPKDEADGGELLGWNQIIEGLIGVIEAVKSDQPFQVIFNAADTAYQAICRAELQIVIERSGRMCLSGDEIPHAEAASARCRAELDFQLECLRAVEEGRSVNKTNL